MSDIGQVFSFFLNTSDEDKKNQTVSAPAFSLTKVLATTATVIAPIAMIIANRIDSLNLSAWQYVTLALGLLAFLAVTASADVLARAYATGQEARQRVAPNTHLIPFKEAVKGSVAGKRGRPPEIVKVLAVAEGDEPYYLVTENGSDPVFKRSSEVTLG